MEIVKCGGDMAEAIAELEERCFEEPRSAAMVREELQNPRSTVLAAVDKGTVMGYMSMQTVLDEGYIGNVATAPEFRRRGIAAALIAEMGEYGRRQELSFMTLEVRAGNLGAIALYEKCGFSRAGLRKNYYLSPREDALIMTYYFKNSEN